MIKIASIYKVKTNPKLNNLSKNTYVIILSKLGDTYKIANFLFSENLEEEFGGARKQYLYEQEITENMDFVDTLNNLLKKGQGEK
jgi:5-bromo-4-chloroindolyl phosphate hydrolysis protein